MKKTLTINLSGIVFNIDEDAYNQLQEYLRNLEKRFPGTDGQEIMHDIEARLAELFSNMLNDQKQSVVTIADVNRAISQLGTADEISDEGDKHHEDNKSNRRRHRKFYRDGENKILGGVASGLAAYLGFDISAVRLILILLAITVLGWLIPIYLIVWIIAPEATTTAQKLEMQGIEPSIENMKEYLNSERFRESATRVGSRLGEVVKWLFRLAAIIVGIIFIVGGACLIGLLIIILLALLAGGGSMFGAMFGSLMPTMNGNSLMITFIASTLIACLIPIISIFMTTIRLIRKDNSPRKKGWGWFWFAIWLIASIVSISTLALNAPHVVRTLQNLDENDFVFILDDNIITEERLRNESFSSIDIDNAIAVQLVADTCCFVEVRGNASNLRSIKTEIEANELKIYLTSPTNNLTNAKGVIVHYCADINKLDIGSASVVTSEDNILKSNNLEIDASSAAVLNLGINCQNLDIEASSAAVINIWGECNSLSADLESASVVNFKDLTTDSAYIQASSGAVIDAPKCQNINIDKDSGAIIKN